MRAPQQNPTPTCLLCIIKEINHLEILEQFNVHVSTKHFFIYFKGTDKQNHLNLVSSPTRVPGYLSSSEAYITEQDS